MAEVPGGAYNTMNNITLKLRAFEVKTLQSGAVTIRGSHSQGKDKDGDYKPSIWATAFVGDKSAKYLPAISKDDYIVVQGRLTMEEYEGKQSFTIWADRLEKLAPYEASSAPKGSRPSKSSEDYDPFADE